MESDYRVTVSVDNDKILKRPESGNFTVEGLGEAVIVFEPDDPNASWQFKEFSVAVRSGYPLGGVFTWTCDHEKIELRDVVTGNGRATYLIKIDQGGKILSDDPEIENKHKVGTVTVTRGVTNVD